ncbi:leucine--tRNA ligase [Planctomycetales bacterium ZRK34]|nr:leucine--tRNA ligase [Planctomycetales bacterium ZRK34]
MTSYEPQTIEQQCQDRWRQNNTFAVPNPGDPGFDATRPKFYVLDMFPYPSGVGLHVGHPLGYIATDIVARYKRMTGYNVLHPMGFDAFGLPAEQYAVEHGVHPRETTEKNIANMVRQLKRLGLSYDWDRRIATTDVAYYKWTQWIFLQLYNSYFNEGEQRAEPISELVKRLESGELDVAYDGRIVDVGASGAMDALGGPPIGARKWHELKPDEQDAVLAEYRLAYLAEVPVNWCPALGTVLANEEVTNEGRSERGNHPVFKRPLKQWMLRITSYAERLAGDLDLVDWPEAIRKMQRDWIGRSEGALVDFEVANADAERSEASGPIRVFTTRPDTLFGATYMVLAPEHPMVDELTTEAQRAAVAEYRKQAESKTDIDRQAETKTKTGVPTGAFAINPVNGQQIPIWIADYVLMGYGTGAIMAVPGHDERDHAFAKAFDLPIVQVIKGGDKPIEDEAYTGPGVNINSSNDDVILDGLPTPDAKRKITQWLNAKGLGKAQVQYKLRDWLFSRQRYWGEPFPILHGPDGEIRAVDEAELPVELPPMDDFSPTSSDDPNAPPAPPLSRAPGSWKNVVIDGVTYTRELNTMPQWAGSCWYYLRFADPRNQHRFAGGEAESYWMEPTGVDLYVGGAEHAVLHLLYARFWHKVLFDLGHVTTPEPFGRLFNQGYIQAYAYQDARGIYVDALKIEEKDGQFFYEGQPVTRNLGKMGKSLKNAVSPDDMCEQYGADTLRLYEMYMGPLDQSKPWNTRDIVGVHRFLQRVWRNFFDDEGKLLITDDAPDDATARLLHKTIKRVTDDMERMSFNTAIAALIELNNALVSLKQLPRAVAEPFVLMLAPLAPHVCEHLWQQLGHEGSVAFVDWPNYDESMLVEDSIQMVVQVLGKVRGRITVPADADNDAIEAAALGDDKVAANLEGKTVRKVIVVPGKLVNIVAN